MPRYWSPWLFFILSTLCTTGARESDSETVFFNALTKRSIAVDIYHILHSARSQNKTVDITFLVNTPAEFRFSKCNQTLLATSKDVPVLRFHFQETMLDWLLSETDRVCYGKSDDADRFRLEIHPSRPTRGKMVFSLGKHYHEINHRTEIGPYFLNTPGGQDLVFKGSFLSSLSNTGHNSTIHLVTNLTSQVKIAFGKCGLRLEDVLYPKDNGKMVLGNDILKKIRYLSDIGCRRDEGYNEFQLLVHTLSATNGALGFSIIRPNYTTMKLIVIGAILLLIFAILGNYLYYRHLRYKEAHYRFGTREATKIYRENFALQAMDQVYDSQGSME